MENKPNQSKENKRLVDSYVITADNVPAKINIYKIQDDNVPLYEISMPELGAATEAFLANLREDLADKVPLDIENAIDPKKSAKLKENFYQEVKQVLLQHLPKEKNVDIIAGVLVHRMYGLGFIDVIMSDDLLEELAINGSKQPLALYHKKFGWCKTNFWIKNEEEIYNLSSQIGRKIGREISSLHPLMDAHLLSGDRVASTLFPITTGGNTITIRRFSRSPWTIIHMISPEFKTVSVEIAALLWLAIQYELNIMVAGGTASGKTSLLSALSALTPPNQRIISIEDTREVSLPEHLQWNWIPMSSRSANPEGKGEITMLDLMVASLRMRPDRIIVGEVRRKEQAETMFEAMHTGHSVYTTMHADTVEQVKRRLLEPPIEIPQMQAESLHLVLIQIRDRRRGFRRSLELAEVLSGGTEKLETNFLYRWRPRTDTFEKVNDSIRIFEDLNIHTGMTPEEINNDLKEKEMILNWMINNDVKDIDKVGKFMKIYYNNKQRLLDIINNKEDLTVLFEGI